MSDTAKHTAFILEDDEDIHTLLSLLLRENMEVVGADNIFETRLLLNTISPTLLFIDQKLPDGMGFDIISEIKVMFPDSVIVAMTANHNTELRESTLLSGADFYVEKPFQIQELYNIIQKVYAARPLVSRHG